MPSVRDIAPDWLTFYEAEEWGVIWKRPPVTERLLDPETYIHHGAGGRFGFDPIAAMRALQKWFHDVKNYSTIGYDIMVHRNVLDDTVAICGVREEFLSAATRDRNELGEAICLFGNFHPGHALSERPTAREIEALAWAVAWSIEKGWSSYDTWVAGHRDNPAHPGDTGCPGDYLYPFVGTIGKRAIEIYNLAHNTTPPEDDMRTLNKPIRVHDSRNGGKPLKPGESVGIDVRPADPGKELDEAFVNITVIGADGAGHLSTNDPSGETSIVNYSAYDQVESNTTMVKLGGGKFIITNHVGHAHVAVDVVSLKP